MEKPWWIRKNEPAADYEDDINGYYGTKASLDEKEDGEQVTDKTYESYDGDGSDVQIALANDPIKEVAKAEPLLKKTFAPKTCQDSQAIVNAYKCGRVVLICVEELDRENFLRLFDYVMGAVQALDGELRRVDRDTVMLLPYGVDEDVDFDALDFDESDYGEEDSEPDDNGEA